MEDTGERFVPTMVGPYDIKVNLDRYRMTMPYCIKKHVLELGCGCGLGTYLYSLVAKSIVGVDYDSVALAYANSYPWNPEKVTLKHMNLTEEVPEEHFDVVVATEFLEHIDDPGTLLAKLNTDKLVFSLPFNSLKVSTWHRYQIRNGDVGIQDIKNLIEKDFKIDDMKVQEGKWVFGIATRKEPKQ